MKTARRILLGIVLLLIIVLIGAFIFINHIAKRGLPDYNESIQLTGMTDQVTVYRDSYAVPHIFAKNEDDLYRAVGYVMAQDRLWQMDLVRRATQGRLAEIFGEALVETDLLMRALRIPEKSRLVLSQADAKVVKMIEAFSDGVNQYIESHKNKLPPEFSILRYVPEKWEPEHAANLIGYMAWPLALAWSSDVLLYQLAQKLGAESEKFHELVPDLSQQKTVVYPDFKLAAVGAGLDSSLLRGARKLEELGLVIFTGSNNWAVSGAKSVTGKPLLANDMHLSLFAPGIWYQIHEVIEGSLNVTGVAVPGQPFIVAGHNDRIAWGMTNVMVDDMDFYLEKLNPANANEYEFNGSWRPLKVRKEEIKVKGGRVIEKELKFTHRGPVVSALQNVRDQAISMRWVGNEESNEIRSVYLLDRAKNWEDFKDAAKTFQALSQNVVYADIDGNIGLHCCAGVPIRKGEGLGVVPGETDEYDWKGFVPFEKLPYSYNPPSGYVSSANNKTVDDHFPYPIGYWFDLPYRIDRIREMLEEKEKLSTEDFMRMQLDVKSKLVEKMKGDILAELRKLEDPTPLEKTSLQLLETWDGTLTKESAATSIFEEFYNLFLTNLIQDEMGEELTKKYEGNSILAVNFMENILRNKNSGWCDDLRTPGVKEGFGDIVRRSFQETVASLREELGSNPDRWEWGKLHVLSLEHPLSQVKILSALFNLNPKPVPVRGSFHTVCALGYDFGLGFKSRFGPSERHVFSLANWDDSKTVIPTGESGIPASKFYCDQTKLYGAGQYHNDYVSRNLIEKDARFKMTISKK